MEEAEEMFHSGRCLYGPTADLCRLILSILEFPEHHQLVSNPNSALFYYKFNIWAQCLLAECMLELGQPDDASKMVNKLLILTKNRNTKVLTTTAKLNGRVGKFKECMEYLMNAVVLDESDKEIRRLIGFAVGFGPSGLSNFHRITPVKPQPCPNGGKPKMDGPAATYAHIGNICRDEGRLEAAIQLYSDAVNACPQKCAFILSLIQLHEINGSHWEIFEAYSDFFSRQELPTIKQNLDNLTSSDLLLFSDFYNAINRESLVPPPEVLRKYHKIHCLV